MSKIKIKSKRTSDYGKKKNLPIVGVVKISKEGILEVEENVADLMINNFDGSWEILDSKKSSGSSKSSKDEGKTEGGEPDSNDGDEDEGNDSDSDGLTEKQMEELSLEELINIAKEAGLKEPSYRKFKGKKSTMIKYLSKHM